MPGPIRVLCIDDNADLAEVLASAIGAEADMECVGTRETAADLAGEIERTTPDVALVDLTIPGCDTLAEVATAARQYPGTRIVVMSGYDDDGTIESAIECGAWGFVPKDDGIDRVLLGIRTVHGGEIFRRR